MHKPYSIGKMYSSMKFIDLFPVLLLVLAACRPATSGAEEAVALPGDLPAGFLDFYERFMTDSLYQMEHILFPLQGLPDRADSAIVAGNSFRWRQEDWNMHHPIERSTGFSIDLKPVTDTYILELIVHHSGQYGMERRWAHMGDGWYLIYYAGLNPLKQ